MAYLRERQLEAPNAAPKPSVLVVGDAPELDGITADARVVRWTGAPDEGTPFVALVFDLRSEALIDLMRIRSAFEGLPLLVFSNDPAPATVLASLRTDAVYVPRTNDDGSLSRVFDLVVELGRMRRRSAEAKAEIDSLCRVLLDRERFNQAILDGVEVGIVTSDEDGLVTFINQTAANLLDVARELPQIRVEQLLRLPKSPGALLGGERRCVFSHPLMTATSELELEISVTRGAAGSLNERVGFFFIFRDIREEKYREAERRKFDRLAAMGTMVAGFAHEVRNPVAAMRSIAEELSEELRDARLPLPHVGRMLQVLERIERLVRTSLQFGRPAAPKRAPQRPWVIVSAAVSELRPRLRDISGDLLFDLEPDLPDVNVDERQLTQALVILLHNALDATNDASRVCVRVRRATIEGDARTSNLRGSEAPPAAAIRFEIADDGPGISPDLIGRIFDPFFTTKPSGTGLGLSIAQQIVSENGAKLEVTSAVGSLTTFAVVVPHAGALT